LLWAAQLFVSSTALAKEFQVLTHLLRITALVASIEVIGFFALHLLGRRHGVMAQGFISGFISSTMVYLDLGRRSDIADYSPPHLAAALLLSTISMLLLSCVIIMGLGRNLNLMLLIPCMLQIIVIGIFVLGLLKKPTHHAKKVSSDLMVDQPVIWAKVLQFSLVFLALLYGMRYLSAMLTQYKTVTTFIVSLFESHAILGAVLIEKNPATTVSDMYMLLLLILLGNVVSKVGIILRIQHKFIRQRVIIALSLSYLFPLIYFWGAKFFL
jgi:uncharacterized membrane protein (DUF4010 family)